MKYKVGDFVTIKKDLKTGEVERPKTDNGTFWTVAVLPEMAKMRGSRVKITNVIDHANRYQVEGSGWLWCDTMFESTEEQKIVITSDGVETLARLYDGNKVVKSASAKCNPEDEFDFKVGAKLAYERLMEEKPKVEEKPVTIENPDAPKKCKFEVGQYYEHKGMCVQGIIKVTKIEDDRVYYEIVEGMKGDSSQKNFVTESGFAMNTAPVTWNVVDRPVKKGDYVRLVRHPYGFSEVGDILKVCDTVGYGVLVFDKDHPRDTGYCDGKFEWCYCRSDFEVVELPGKEKTEPKSTFKEGDRVRHEEYGDGTVINKCRDGQYGVEFDEKKGWCHNCDGFDLEWGKRGTKSTSTWCWPEDLTLITEKPKKTKTQLYNGKVVCVDLNDTNHGFYTVGKVYKFEDGMLTADNGHKFPAGRDIYTFEDWAKWTGSKFIEVVE